MSEAPDPALVPEWTLGWRLQRALAHAGISVNEIARDMGVSRATISRWINDRGAQPRPIFIRRWAVVCNVPYAWLLSGDPHPLPSGGRFRSERSLFTLARMLTLSAA